MACDTVPDSSSDRTESVLRSWQNVAKLTKPCRAARVARAGKQAWLSEGAAPNDE